MKKTVATLAALAAIAGIVVFGAGVRAQPTGGAPAAQPQRSKIALVNIAKVLKEYNKANFQGKEIATKRQEYLDRVNAFRNAMNEKTKLAQTPAGQAQKDQLQREVTDLQRKIEDIDREAQKVLTEMANTTVVRVYNEIKGVVDAIAVANGMELVLIYPDATTPTDENTAMVAQLKLQTPALMPLYARRDLDITEYVVRALNERYPAPAVNNTTPMGTNPAVRPTGGMQP